MVPSCLDVPDEYHSFTLERGYLIEFRDYNDLNFILIPTGDLGRNGSQEITIILRLEEENYTIFQKYLNGTMILPYSPIYRVIDGTGTPWLNVSLSSFSIIPNEKFYVEVYTNRIRTEGNYVDESVNETKWLQPTKYIDSNHSTIITKAEEITTPSQSRKTKVTNIINFVKREVEYNESYFASKQWVDNSTFYGEENGKASDVLRTKQGICSHYARLCAALCRASGVPSRFVAGYRITYDEKWDEFDTVLHAWAEYYDQQRWYYIEPELKILDIYPADYFHLISGLMQEDSFFIESKYPDMYILNNKGDYNTQIDQYAYYINHTLKANDRIFRGMKIK